MNKFRPRTWALEGVGEVAAVAFVAAAWAFVHLCPFHNLILGQCHTEALLRLEEGQYLQRNWPSAVVSLKVLSWLKDLETVRVVLKVG